MKTLSKELGLASAAAIAVLVAAAGAPALRRSAARVVALVMYRPSSPITTLVGGEAGDSRVPSAARMSALGGHTTDTANMPSLPSAGSIVARFQSTSQLFACNRRWRVVWIVRGPIPASVNLSVTCVDARLPLVVGCPATYRALETSSAFSTCSLSAPRSGGG